MGGGSPLIRLGVFRYQNNDNADVDLCSFAANQNTNYSIEPDTPFILRIKLENIGTARANNTTYRLEYNKNSTGWQDVSGTSLNIRSVGCLPPNGQVIDTELLTNQGGIFVNGEFDDNNALVGVTLRDGDETEFAFGIQIRSQDTTQGDTFEFRITAPLIAFQYDATPGLTTLGINNTTQLDAETLDLETVADDNTLFYGHPVRVFGEDGNIALIDYGRNFAGSGTAISIAFSQLYYDGLDIQPGDLIVAHIGSYITGTNVSDNNGSTPFTNQFTTDDPGSFTGEISVWTRFYQSGDPSTLNFTINTTSPWYISVRVYRNVDSAIFDVAPLLANADFGTDTSTGIGSVTIGSITTTAADSMAVGFWSLDNGGQSTLGFSNVTAGWRLRNLFTLSATAFIVAYEKFIPTAGATGDLVLTFNQTITNTWFGVQYALLKSTGDPNTSQLDAETIDLTDNDPQAVTTEKHIAALAAASLAVAAFAPQVTATENNISQLESETLTVTNYAPQVTVEAASIVQLPGATLSLSDNDPTIVTTENNVAALDAETLDLTNFDPTAVSTDNNTVELPAVAGSGTFTYVGGAASRGTTASSPNVNHGLSIQSGDLVVAYVHSNATTAITPNDTWDAELFDEEPDSPTETSRNAMYWKVATGSEPSNYGWTAGVGNWGVVLKVFRPSGGTITVDLPALKGLNANSIAAIRSVAQNGRTAATDAVSIIAGGKDNRTVTADPIDTVDGGYTAAIGNGEFQVTGMAHKIGGGAEPAQVDLSGSGQADISYAYHVSFKLVSGGLALTNYAPQATVAANNFAQLLSDTLSLSDNDPTVVTTENNIAALDSETLDLTDFDPQAVTTENHFSQLDAETLNLTDFDPQAVTTENHFSQLDAETLELVDHDPTVVATDNNFSQLDAETLGILDFDPTIITTEAGAGDISLLPRPVLTVGDNDPQAVTTENTNPNTSQLDAETLDLADFDPQAVTTETNVAALDAETLDLVGFDPQAVTTENHFSQLDAETIDLVAFNPEAVTSEGEVSLLPAEALSIADFDPQTVTTENNFSQLDAETLSLADFDPTIVTTETTVNTSQLPSQSLALADFDPTVATTENRVSLLDAETLDLVDNNPQIVTTEGQNPNQSNLGAETLVLADFDPQAVTTEANISGLPNQALTIADLDPTIVATENNFSQLDAEAITLTAYAPIVEFSPPRDRLFVIT